MDCTHGCSLIRKGDRKTPNAANAAATLRAVEPTDELAKCICSTGIPKISLHMWRIRRGNLPTRDRLQKRGMYIPTECLLCGEGIETISHIFFQCRYARWLLKEAFKATGGLVIVQQIEDFESTARKLNKVTIGSKSRGLNWTLMEIVLHGIWKGAEPTPS